VLVLNWENEQGGIMGKFIAVTGTVFSLCIIILSSFMAKNGEISTAEQLIVTVLALIWQQLFYINSK
jgi:hypothetical protein